MMCSVIRSLNSSQLCIKLSLFGRSGEMLAQPVHDAEQRLLDGSDRGSHQLRNLLTGHAFLVFHQEHEPLPLRNALQQAKNLLHDEAVVDGPFGITGYAWNCILWFR